MSTLGLGYFALSFSYYASSYCIANIAYIISSYSFSGGFVTYAKWSGCIGIRTYFSIIGDSGFSSFIRTAYFLGLGCAALVSIILGTGLVLGIGAL